MFFAIFNHPGQFLWKLGRLRGCGFSKHANHLLLSVVWTGTRKDIQKQYKKTEKDDAAGSASYTDTGRDDLATESIRAQKPPGSQLSKANAEPVYADSAKAASPVSVRRALCGQYLFAGRVNPAERAHKSAGCHYTGISAGAVSVRRWRQSGAGCASGQNWRMWRAIQSCWRPLTNRTANLTTLHDVFLTDLPEKTRQRRKNIVKITMVTQKPFQ